MHAVLYRCLSVTEDAVLRHQVAPTILKVIAQVLQFFKPEKLLFPGRFVANITFSTVVFLIRILPHIVT